MSTNISNLEGSRIVKKNYVNKSFFYFLPYLFFKASPPSRVEAYLVKTPAHGLQQIHL